MKQAGQFLKTIYAQKLSIPEIAIERSTSNWGDSERLRRLFRKLHAGAQYKSAWKYTYLVHALEEIHVRTYE